jgi:hypothetical protein
MRQQRTLLLMPQVLVAQQEQLSVQLQVLEVVLEVQQLVLVLVLVLVLGRNRARQLPESSWHYASNRQKRFSKRLRWHCASCQCFGQKPSLPRQRKQP